LPAISNEENALKTVLVLVLSATAVWLAWRLVSRRRSLPCPAWLSWMVDNPFALRRTGATLDHLRLAPGLHVLDAGCGPGRLSIPMALAVAPGGSVLALDIQAAMLRRAREKAEKSGVRNIQYLQAGLGDGRLPESRFDRAVLSTVLGEIPDCQAALIEIRNSLKPGGFLLVNEVMGDPHYQSPARVMDLALKAGLRPGAFHGSRLAYSIVLEKTGSG
jgi:2-polyprenyl-3-methyl-5-hydroxy-6-metoxy-1,4-benzoquinol methylase